MLVSGESKRLRFHAHVIIPSFSTSVTPQLMPIASPLEYTFSGGWAKNPNMGKARITVTLDEALVRGAEPLVRETEGDSESARGKSHQALAMVSDGARAHRRISGNV